MLGDEERLAAAVIAQAILDAGIAGRVDGPKKSVTPLDRDEAISFLTSNSQSWKVSREAWCAMVGICPDRLRSHVLAALPKPKPEPAQPPTLLRRQPRPGTKQAIALERLASPEGLDADAFAAEFGWKKNTVLCLLVGDLPKLFGVRGVRGPDGRYRLAPAVPKSA